MAKVSVLGCGWGTALAIAAHNRNHDVTLWSPFEAEIADLRKYHQQRKLLPGVIIPYDISVTTDLSACDGSDLILVAVPSRFMRETAQKLKSLTHCGILVTVAKGVEDGSLLRMSQVLQEALPGNPVVVLSGPSHAEEVGRNIPTSLVATSACLEDAEAVQNLLMSHVLRIYTQEDTVGVELGGALKNVIALCAGVLDGLGCGDNTKAALMTRGLAEIARLGVAMGAQHETFMGLTGMGDLIVTCCSEHSRNHRFGVLVGQGMPVGDALAEVGTVEGYYATKTAYFLAEKYGVEMPITQRCYDVLYNEKKPLDSIKLLMGRPGKSEKDLLLS